MKIIILAAGRGSRMGNKTNTLPKGMTTIFDKPILQHCIETFERAGVDRKDIGVVTGYKAEKIEFEGVRYYHNANWENTNMFMSLLEAKEWLLDEKCIIAYSDILFSVDVAKQLLDSDRDLAISYYTEYWDLWQMRFDDPLDDLETFKVEADKLIEIGQKPLSKDEVMGQYMGLLQMKPVTAQFILDMIEEMDSQKVLKMDMTTLLQLLLARGIEISLIKTSDIWLECDNQYDVDMYEKVYQECDGVITKK